MLLNRQADVARWNLARFAESLLFSEDDAAIAPLRDIIDDFPSRFQRRYRGLHGAKLGLPGCDAEDDTLIDGCLENTDRRSNGLYVVFPHLAGSGHEFRG